ncbi:cuticlin-6-like isoform X2 [Ciona intestinalis]
MLAPGNGNRPDVPDVVFTITDGRAQDDVVGPSNLLRANGAQTFVVGIDPGRAGMVLRRDHLLEIAGSESNVFHIDGFSGLTTDFAAQLAKRICIAVACM